MKIESTIDLTIILLSYSDWEIDSVVRLDKMLQLLYRTGLFDICFKEQMDEEGFPYKYGPFCYYLLSELQALEEEGFIGWNGNKITLQPGYRMILRRYRANHLQVSMMKCIASLSTTIELDDLLGFVYSLKMR